MVKGYGGSSRVDVKIPGMRGHRRQGAMRLAGSLVTLIVIKVIV